MSQTAMFSKTGSADFPSFLKCMITGPPKSGKTTLLGTVPNILVLDTEPHANNLQSIAHLDIPFKAIYSTDDLRQAQFILSQESFRKQAAEALGLQDIEAVAIDTLDTLQAIMKRERMKEQRSTQFLRDDWGWLKEEMLSIIQSFTALPMHVFFIVHTKSQNVGTEKNPKNVILPGLEGAIAEKIAGEVGYSLLSFRKEEVRQDGTKYTKYWLRAEGDETYEYLGNRAAGRLPDVIEPDFATLLKAAMANRPTHEQKPVEVDFSGLQTTGQAQQQAQQPAQQAPPQQQVAQSAGQQQQGTPQALPSDDEPMSAAAIGHVKKVYDALGQPFPEAKIQGMNLGQARNLVRMWKASQHDEAEGKGNAKQDMLDYLGGQGLLSLEEQRERAKNAPIEAKVDGTIEQVKAYVGDDLGRANEALKVEQAGKGRSSLIEWLESKGAQSQTAVETPTETPEEAPKAPEEGVTSEPEAADDTPTEEQAVATAQEALGGEVISEGINPEALCEECGNQIDDVDLAQLGKSRFGRILCVGDYIAETKK